MSQKILVVDDEPGIVAVIQSYFETAGYQVITAYSGNETMKKLAHNPDLISVSYTHLGFKLGRLFII